MFKTIRHLNLLGNSYATKYLSYLLLQDVFYQLYTNIYENFIESYRRYKKNYQVL